MTNLLKTFLHILSVVVLCSAMAACTNVDGHSVHYDAIQNVSSGGSTSLFE